MWSSVQHLPLLQGLRQGRCPCKAGNLAAQHRLRRGSEAESNGEVIEIGTSLGDVTGSPAFVIPAYLQEQYPELDSVEDLKDERFKALFATPETGGKARLVSCVQSDGRVRKSNAVAGRRLWPGRPCTYHQLRATALRLTLISTALMREGGTVAWISVGH